MQSKNLMDLFLPPNIYLFIFQRVFELKPGRFFDNDGVGGMKDGVWVHPFPFVWGGILLTQW